MTTDMDDLAAHLQQCNAAFDACRTTSKDDAADQAQALQAVRHAAQQLERAASTPAEQLAAVRNGGQRAAILRLAVAIGLFPHVSEEQSRTVAQLAHRADATPELVHRVGRGLATLGFLVEEASPAEAEHDLYTTLRYRATPLGTHFAADPDAQAGFEYVFDVHVGALCSMGDYLITFGKRSPADPRNCPVVFAQGARDTDYFAQMAKRPDRVARFTRTMEAMNEASFAQMAGSYDFGALEAIHGGVLVVDVGGGDGRMLARLRERFPVLKGGRCVLQDLPEVVARGTLGGEGVEVMGYDFLAGEQPVKGAAAYFHQHILHDWPTETCRLILRNLRPAMALPSRLLLSEMIVEDQHPPLERCVTDMTMMVVGGQERSKAQWTALLASEGFRVLGFYGEGNAVNGVIEAVKDETWAGGG